jgi:hypothetical protein
MITIISKGKFEIKSLAEIVYVTKEFKNGKETVKAEVAERKAFFVEGKEEINRSRNWAVTDSSIIEGVKNGEIKLIINGNAIDSEDDLKTTEDLVEELILGR